MAQHLAPDPPYEASEGDAPQLYTAAGLEAWLAREGLVNETLVRNVRENASTLYDLKAAAPEDILELCEGVKGLPAARFQRAVAALRGDATGTAAARAPADGAAASAASAPPAPATTPAPTPAPASATAPATTDSAASAPPAAPPAAPAPPPAPASEKMPQRTAERMAMLRAAKAVKQAQRLLAPEDAAAASAPPPAPSETPARSRRDVKPPQTYSPATATPAPKRKPRAAPTPAAKAPAAKAKAAKSLAPAPDSLAALELRLLGEAGDFVEKRGWPRSKLEGWRCVAVPRIANPSAWDPYWISPHGEVARSSKYVLALVAEYVQCCACDALRRLPGPLSGLDAPESLCKTWRCRDNTWDEAVAYCEAAEEDRNGEIKPLSGRVKETLKALRAEAADAPEIPAKGYARREPPRKREPAKGGGVSDRRGLEARMAADGWTVVEKPREGVAHVDKYYLPPGGGRQRRSVVEVARAAYPEFLLEAPETPAAAAPPPKRRKAAPKAPAPPPPPPPPKAPAPPPPTAPCSVCYADGAPVLPCGHASCGKCLAAWARHLVQSGATRSTRRGSGATCPLCRKFHVVEP